jgi:hypothetical protein
MKMESINRERLEKYIKILTDNYQLKFSDIEKDSKLDIAMRTIEEANNKGDLELPGSILKQYRPSELRPDTIGSFLFGCLQQTYGDVPMECSPLCAYGIKSNDEMEVKKCSNQIYVQYTNELNNRFYKLYECDSRQGYLFVHINFMGITKREKKFFIDNGIYRLQILVTHNSKHHTVIKMRDIDDIPIIEEFDGIFYTASEAHYSDEENIDESNNAVYYILISIAVLLVMAAAYGRN